MNTLYITRGLPASGKTTRARAWVAESPAARARVNRDDLRAMVHDGAWLGDATERGIIAARDAMIRALLSKGKDVVCDDTNLPSRTVRDLRRLAQLCGAGFEVWDMTDIGPEECVGRDAWRKFEGKRAVGHDVIRDMHKRFIAGKPYPLTVPADPDEPPAGSVYVAPAGAPPAIIVDIDGTVALHGTRSPFDESRVHEDRPNTSVIKAVEAMYAMGYEVIFCSGRKDSCRKATEAWLKRHVNVVPDMVLMRDADDNRKDAIVKRMLFDEFIRTYYDVRAVFDDRNQVVEMWRSLGLTVFQVAEGNF